MASKKKVEKETASWAGGIEKYSRQIWLAGLGAYSKTAADGGKLFDSLVKEGEKAEKQAKGEIDKQVVTAKAATQPKTSGLKEKALGKWGELEEAFDQRLNSAISRLGVPSRNEVAALHEKVDVLMRELERLTGSATPLAQTEAPSSAKPLASVTRKAAAGKSASAKPAPAAAAAAAAAAAPTANAGKATAKAATPKPGLAKTVTKARAKPTSTVPDGTASVATTEKKTKTRKPATKAGDSTASSEPAA